MQLHVATNENAQQRAAEGFGLQPRRDRRVRWSKRQAASYSSQPTTPSKYSTSILSITARISGEYLAPCADFWWASSAAGLRYCSCTMYAPGFERDLSNE